MPRGQFVEQPSTSDRDVSLVLTTDTDFLNQCQWNTKMWSTQESAEQAHAVDNAIQLVSGKTYLQYSLQSAPTPMQEDFQCLPSPAKKSCPEKQHFIFHPNPNQGGVLDAPGPSHSEVPMPPAWQTLAQPRLWTEPLLSAQSAGPSCSPSVKEEPADVDRQTSQEVGNFSAEDFNLCKKEPQQLIEGEIGREVSINPDTSQAVKNHVRRRRMKSGKPELITDELFPEPVQHPLTKNEEERLERRRAQNRKAAATSRIKRKVSTDAIKEDNKKLKEQNEALTEEVTKLNREISLLRKVYKQHVQFGGCKLLDQLHHARLQHNTQGPTPGVSVDLANTAVDQRPLGEKTVAQGPSQTFSTPGRSASPNKQVVTRSQIEMMPSLRSHDDQSGQAAETTYGIACGTQNWSWPPIDQLVPDQPSQQEANNADQMAVPMMIVDQRQGSDTVEFNLEDMLSYEESEALNILINAGIVERAPAVSIPSGDSFNLQAESSMPPPLTEDGMCQLSEAPNSQLLFGSGNAEPPDFSGQPVTVNPNDVCQLMYTWQPATSQQGAAVTPNQSPRCRRPTGGSDGSVLSPPTPSNHMESLSIYSPAPGNQRDTASPNY